MNRTFRKLAAIMAGLGIFFVCLSFDTVRAKESDYPPPAAQTSLITEVIEESTDTIVSYSRSFIEEREVVAREITSVKAEVIETPDRTKPIYEVYKNGLPVADATAEVQWAIRDIASQYNLPEKMIFGLITAESTFVPNLESFDGGCWGLAQINTFWITRANITHFTDDYRSRDLCDPYDNLLTLAELMCYARDAYGLDLSTQAGQIKYLYWHNTGQDPTRVTRWDYATRALGYAAELVTLQS